MEWNLDKKLPLCPQICEHLCVEIALKRIRPGEKIPSVREAAMAAGVTPNTVQHAYETLESEGVLFSIRGSGWFATADSSVAQATIDRVIQKKTEAYFTAMKVLGMTDEEIKQYVKEWNT